VSVEKIMIILAIKGHVFLLCFEMDIIIMLCKKKKKWMARQAEREKIKYTTWDG